MENSGSKASFILDQLHIIKYSYTQKYHMDKGLVSIDMFQVSVLNTTVSSVFILLVVSLASASKLDL